MLSDRRFEAFSLQGTELLEETTTMSPLPKAAESVLLIIENFDKIRADLAHHFVSAGYRLFSAATLRDALTLSNDNIPDVVILDFELRGGQALSAIEQLRTCLPQLHSTRCPS
jgi:ActR/RegA family two-component response regulator